MVGTIQKAYFHYRIIRTSILHDRKPFACSLAPTLACNLACSFCYTASPRAVAKGQKTRQLLQELTVNAFKELCLVLRKRGIRHATLTDGEPLLTEQSREKCKVATEIFDQTWIVTNGTFGFPRFRNTLYIVSLDGDEETHDHIRGKGVFAKIRQNISYGGIPADCYCNTTLSRLNHAKIGNIVEGSKEPRSERNLFWMVYSHESKGCVISAACRTPEGYRRNTKAEASLLWRLHLKLGQGARSNEKQSMVQTLPYMVCRVIRCLW